MQQLRSTRSLYRQAGFNLLELLVVLVVAGALIGVALPGYFSFIEQAQVRTAAREIVSSFNVARIEAIRQGVTLQVCGLGSGNCSTDWSEGWEIRRISPDQKVFSRIDDLGSRVAVDYLSANPVSFTREGQLGRQLPIQIQVSGLSQSHHRCIDLTVAGYTNVQAGKCE